MKKFLSEIADETVDLKSLGIRGTDKQKIIDMLYLCYNYRFTIRFSNAEQKQLEAYAEKYDLTKGQVLKKDWLNSEQKKEKSSATRKMD